MIYSIETQEYLKYIPHKQDYDFWRSRLSDAEYNTIITELQNRIDGKEIATSSWIPGSDWTDTVFQPIWEKACSKDDATAAKFFGLLVWEVFLNHEDVWSFGRYKKDDIPIKGLTYFILKNPPPQT